MFGPPPQEAIARARSARTAALAEANVLLRHRPASVLATGLLVRAASARDRSLFVSPTDIRTKNPNQKHGPRNPVGGNVGGPLVVDRAVVVRATGAVETVAPFRASDGGGNQQLAPGGAPPHSRETVRANPPRGGRVSEPGAVCPATKTDAPGEMESEKSGKGISR